MFRDRNDAAEQLARALEPYSGKSPLVLAIPRGAVPMGRRIAEALGGDLDVVLVRKIGAPYQRELALGAIDEDGEMHWASPEAANSVDPVWLEHEKYEQLELLRQRRDRYRRGRPPIDPEGRVTIVVDDGLATGSTMIAALHATRARSPSLLICAVPVAAPESLERVSPHADELVCLETPEHFRAVSLHYQRFEQVDDADVERLLAER
ncbi:MAG: phosphoribosyltransferase [Burkholderiaceae bacterium]|nr:phosphoribosyltransferase [Burkholderiaceae bacterium]